MGNEIFEEIKKRYKKSNKYMLCVSYEDIGILIQIIETIKRDYISKKKLNKKIEDFKIIRDTIIQNEKELNRPMMTYDLKRNDYCIKMLQSLLKEEE